VDPGPPKHVISENRTLSLLVTHPFFRLWVYPVLCYIWFVRPLSSNARAAPHLSLSNVRFIIAFNSIFLPLSLYFSASSYLLIQHEYLSQSVL
jgi:hypothetical protein